MEDRICNLAKAAARAAIRRVKKDPLLASRTTHGVTDIFYKVPHRIGKLNVDKALDEHEKTEGKDILAGESQPEAHMDALHKEHAYVREHMVSPSRYEAILRRYQKMTNKEKPSDLPKDTLPAQRPVVNRNEPEFTPEEKAAAGMMAMGIPDRNTTGNPLSLEEGRLADFIIQRHLARRAGPHNDIRIGSPSHQLYSWATKKELPEPGDRIALYQQPLHSFAYKDFEGQIGSGYGAGTVKKQSEGKVLVTRSSPNALQFTVASRYPQRYTLVKPQGDRKGWLLMNTTPTEAIPYNKMHFRTIPAEQADQVISQMAEGTSAQPKIDGAAALVKLLDNSVEVASYRTSKQTGYPLIHTERVFRGRPRVDVPPELRGSILRGEVYGTRDGKAIPVQELGSVLNSSLDKALGKTQNDAIKMKVMLFNLQRLGKKDIDPESVPYAQRRQMLQDVLGKLDLPELEMIPEATTPAEAAKLLAAVRSGQHPLTEEGIVLHPPTGKPFKIPLESPHDVHVRNIFPETGLRPGMAGGFDYSLTPTGPVVGRVGSGFLHAVKRDMLENPQEYQGRVAKVLAKSQFPSGALRAPVFQGFHEDYPLAETPGAKEARQAQVRPQNVPIAY